MEVTQPNPSGRESTPRGGKPLVQGPKPGSERAGYPASQAEPSTKVQGGRTHLCHDVFGLLEPAGPRRPDASLSRLPRPRLYSGQGFHPSQRPGVGIQSGRFVGTCHSRVVGAPCCPKRGVAKWCESGRGHPGEGGARGSGPASQGSGIVMWPCLPLPSLPQPQSSTTLPLVPCASRHLHLLKLRPWGHFQMTSIITVHLLRTRH